MMKAMMWSLSVTLAAAWTSSQIAIGGGPDCDQQAKKVLVKICDDQSHAAVVAGSGEVAPQRIVVRKTLTADGSAGVTVEPETFQFVVASSEDSDPDAGWLGVVSGPVSGELAKQLGDMKGLVITNVAKGSPAAQAGFEQYDVVTAINHEAIGDDVGAFAKQIREAGVGARLSFSIVRNGQQRTLTATLAQRSQATMNDWVYEFGPEAQFGESIRSKARFLKKGDDGKWTLEDLGKLHVAPLPAGAMGFLPKYTDKNVQVTVNDGPIRFAVSVNKNGQTISVKREGEGDFVVTRVTETGEESEVSYATEDELANGDAEAFEIVKECIHGAVTESDGSGVGFEWNPDDGQFYSFDKELDLHFDGAAEMLADHLEKLKELHVEVNGLPGHGGSHMIFQHAGVGKALRTIRANPDGSIDVTVRKGEDELVSHFTSVEDLKRRDAASYDKYMELQAAEDD